MLEGFVAVENDMDPAKHNNHVKCYLATRAILSTAHLCASNSDFVTSVINASQCVFHTLCTSFGISY